MQSRKGESSSSSSTGSADSPSEPISTSQKYISERLQLASGVEEVRRRALTGALRASRLRSLAWAILLGVIPPNVDCWLQEIRKNRLYYAELIQQHSCDPRFCDHPEDDPLSQNDESLWNKHFQNAELQTVIKLDVVRTFPGVEFFKQPEIQQAMINILFCYARENPQLLYRQGMHEILAPLLFVLQSDHRAAEHTNLDGQLTEIMDPQYLEHDGYALFRVIMYGIEKFYRINETPPMSPLEPDKELSLNFTGERKRIEVEVVRYLNDIKDNLLFKTDHELAEHLQKSDISLSLFGVRWLRVLFGREFTLHDLLVLWDAMFAEDEDFSLAGFIMVAMLIAIRTPLLSKDPMVCLTYLMHYPSTVDVQYIIEHALYLKHPKQYCQPYPRFFDVLPQRNMTVVKKAAPNVQQKPIHDPRLRMTKIKVASTADDSIIDGMTLQDCEHLKEELYHAHSVMNLCHVKLEKYEEILRHALPPTYNSSHPAYQALGGVKELCTLLKSRYHNPPAVEPALEANESSELDNKHRQRSKKLTNKTPTGSPHKGQTTAAGGSPNKHPTVKEVELKLLQKTQSNSALTGAPSIDPLGIHND